MYGHLRSNRRRWWYDSGGKFQEQLMGRPAFISTNINNAILSSKGFGTPTPTTRSRFANYLRGRLGHLRMRQAGLSINVDIYTEALEVVRHRRRYMDGNIRRTFGCLLGGLQATTAYTAG